MPWTLRDAYPDGDRITNPGPTGYACWDLRPGERFPDIELPNQDGEATKLSGLMVGFPTIVVFSRGYY